MRVSLSSMLQLSLGFCLLAVVVADPMPDPKRSSSKSSSKSSSGSKIGSTISKIGKKGTEPSSTASRHSFTSWHD